ncbi:hypothetical protein FA15DRAFT_670330 [Coprinopsis marcescibilis]|uniref:Uncharacterized protein n=1 Tax=Coprinopsis marcescibilis TaxID=230819 RepID=A0A5C3KT38_COPMA|nr:hypothetical protein FA15DRAFT_670330 [Coprinopsis marcescibilis]
MGNNNENQSSEHLRLLDAQLSFATVVLKIFAAGIQLFMCTYGLSAFLETPRDLRTGRGIYITTSFIIFSLFSLWTFLECFNVFQTLLQFPFPSGNYLVNQGLSWDRILSTLALFAFIFIGDALLLYRCFLLWNDTYWIIVLPTMAYLASISMGILTSVQMLYSQEGIATRLVSSTSVFLAVATNVLITSLLCIRLISARKGISSLTDSRSASSLASAALITLVETALPLTLFGLVYSINLLVTPSAETQISDSIITPIFGTLYIIFNALSPQLIIFRVTIGRSWNGVQNTDAGNRHPSAPITFAYPAGVPSDDDVELVGPVLMSSDQASFEMNRP